MKSMTGFGRAAKRIGGWRITAEVRTLNHRFLDPYIRMPSQLADLEMDVRKLIFRYINRGRVELAVRLDADGIAVQKPKLNRAVLESYIRELKKLRQFGVEGSLDLATLLRLPNIFEYEEVSVGEEVRRAAMDTVELALKRVVSLRKREGAALKREFAKRCRMVRRMLSEVAKLEPQVKADAKEALFERIESLKIEGIDQARLVHEVALLLQRLDFTEEIVRLKEHAHKFDQLLKEEGPIGRKLEFILQECHREITTLANKAQSAQISEIAVEIKAELEKMREQVQNIE